MNRELRSGSDRIAIGSRHEYAPGVLVEFSDPSLARDFLSRFLRDASDMAVLRACLLETTGSTDISQLTRGEVLDQVAFAVATGQLRVIRMPEIQAAAVSIKSEREKLAPPAEPASQAAEVVEKVWITFQVVNDETDAPVPNVQLEVTLPDGSVEKRLTDSSGTIHIDGLESGSCDLASSFVGKRRTETLSVVSVAADSLSNEAPEEGDHTLCLADVSDHKVSRGESLGTLADDAGITWQELSKFNWGTASPRQINKHLRDDVGCTKKTKDGNNYVFDDSDSPGIVYIPAAWDKGGLATEKVHSIRVTRGPIVRQMTISFILGAASDVGQEFPKYVLESADGEYSEERSSKDDLMEGDVYLQLLFDELLPGKKYTLTRFFDDKWSETIFENVPFDAIVDQGRDDPEGLIENAFTGFLGLEDEDEVAWEDFEEVPHEEDLSEVDA